MIIGISGLAGSGKDTCADFLVGRYGFVKRSFADPVKKIAREVFAFSDEQLWGPSEARNAPDTRYPREHTWEPDYNDGWHTCLCCGAKCKRGEQPDREQCYLTPRFALQQLGTAWGRTCYPNVWVDLAIRNARYGDTVIPDVRFKNEVDGLRAAGAYLVRIMRPDAGLKGSAGQHVSETEQTSMPNEMFDAVIRNDRGLRELEEAVTDLVRHWGDR
jgi:hypothetical protein